MKAAPGQALARLQFESLLKKLAEARLGGIGGLFLALLGLLGFGRILLTEGQTGGAEDKRQAKQSAHDLLHRVLVLLVFVDDILPSSVSILAEGHEDGLNRILKAFHGEA
jgi:hypothetical protein